MPIDKKNLATVEMMWRREVEAATTYKHLADRERDPKRKDILLRLASQEDNHAARWAERITATTGRTPDRKEVERMLTELRTTSPTVLVPATRVFDTLDSANAYSERCKQSP